MLAYLRQEGRTTLSSAEQLIVDNGLDGQKRNGVTRADQGDRGCLHLLAQ